MLQKKLSRNWASSPCRLSVLCQATEVRGC